MTFNGKTKMKCRMRKIQFIAIVSLLALASCVKETREPEKGRTVVNAYVESVKTALGEKEGTAYPNYWKENDAISINGVESEPLASSDDGKASASFIFDAVLDVPYDAAYPASAVSQYSAGTAVITLPACQNYVEGSYDPASFIMTGRSTETGSVSLSANVSIFHLSLSGSTPVRGVRLTGEAGSALSGSFTTDFSTLAPKEVSDVVALNCDTPVALPADFFICVPAGLVGKVQVEVFDNEGCSMIRTASIKNALTAGQMYTAPTLEYVPTAVLSASLKGVTTSSAAFTWTHSGDKSFDISKPYTIALFSDLGCSSKVISLDIPADAECWDGKQPCFVFGGLESGRTYYFRATDTDGGITSNVVAATTGEFTNVAYDQVVNPAVGDVILAENFNEWGYGTDETMNAAGFYNNDAALTIYSGDMDMENVSLQKPSSTARRLFNQTNVKNTGSRIESWGFAGNSSVYLRAGYLRVTTTASSNRTHIVSPKLAAIPDGKLADVDVTVRMLRTESDNDFGVLVQTGTMNENYTTGSGAPICCKLQSGFTDSDAYPFNMTTAGSWETHTVTVQNLTNANSLAFGSISNISGKNRFYIGEISVKLVALYDPSPLTANCSDKTSSTLAFKWTEGGSVDEDIANAYTATLYRDQACTQVDQTFDFPAGMGAWDSKSPCYIFGGLTPSTTYWFKVKDTTNGIESNPVKATTDDFTVVTLPSEISGTGVVLAEDFGELRWDFDNCFGASGFFPTSNTDFSNTAVSSYRKNGDGSEKTFKGQGTALGKSRLNDWVTDSNVYIHPGSLKLGTSSGRGWILTPEFNVPEGKKAIVNVTVTIARHNGSQDNDWAIVVLTPELAEAKPSSHSADFSWPDVSDPANYQTVNITNSSVWNTRDVSGLEIHHGDRIAFGGKKGGSGSKGRVWISDLTVEVTDIVDEKGEQGQPLTVLYWNIQNGMCADQVNGYSRFNSWVSSQNPDICVWCEAAQVYKNDGSEKGYNFFTGERTIPSFDYGHSSTACPYKKTDYPNMVTVGGDLSFASKTSVKDNEKQIYTKVKLGGKEINIVTVHLSKSVTDGVHEGLAEIKAVLAATVGKSANPDDEYWMIAGDFNAICKRDNDLPNSPYASWSNDPTTKKPKALSYAVINEVLNHSAGFLDCIAEKYPGQFVSTRYYEHRIDYVFCNPKLYDCIDSIEIPTVSFGDYGKFTLGSQTEFRTPSDHKPIKIKFTI